ncbi:MAG: AAA family ATPase, partial [Pseudomonadota bacterium]
AAGYDVRGAALSGIAAENLESGSGIASRTIASLEHSWKDGRDTLTSHDVLVIDEAGMVGTRQLGRVLSHAAHRGAKILLVGDPQQLQAIEAGAAFRSLYERHGGAEIGTVRRQRDDWQREATRGLATGRTKMAIEAYDAQSMVHEAQTRERARAELIERWDRDRQTSPDSSRIILTHTNAEVRTLNDAARERMRAAGDLGEEVRLTVERGARSCASGDRVMFLQNERSLGVKNGTLGTIVEVSAQSMGVRLDGGHTDDGHTVRFDLKDYNRIDHGYAATIHKAQGMTVDRTHVLATPGLDAHGSYVTLSRHRDGMDLHYGRDDFVNQNQLVRTLSRDRAKDMATDYMATDYDQLNPAQSFAERRGISFRDRVTEVVRTIVPEPVRERIGGVLNCLNSDGTMASGAKTEPKPEREDVGAASLTGSGGITQPVGERRARPVSANDPEGALRRARTRALIRHARACEAVLEAKGQGLTPPDDQRRELGAARRAFEEVRPHGWQDAEAAYSKDNSLAGEAGTGKVRRAVRALYLETERRMERDDLALHAKRFVARWQDLDTSSQRQYRAGDMSGYRSTRASMGAMAKSLERDPQLESLLPNRKRELGTQMETGRRLGQELAFCHGLDMGRGRGLSR